MPDHDAPPLASADAADRLVDDMGLFLRGGPVPDTTYEVPGVPDDGTMTFEGAAATADPGAYTPSPAGLDTTPDREIGPYRVIRFVAHGGMGDVFYARHRVLPREVALKTIRARLAGDPGILERFELEAKAVENLDHPNVVKLYDFDAHAGEPYIAMEWVPGGDLAKRLKGRPLPPREAAVLVRALADAMAYAHGRGVLHRDLKPQNVLLSADGIPKVADFGLARLLAGDDSEWRLTQTGAIMGTPPYMAPEQASGKDGDVRTDVYALGAILYEVLTRKPPFAGDSKDAVLKQVRESDPPRPSSLADGVPADLEFICLKCLSKHAADRYQTAGELVADLDRFLNGEPLPWSPWRRLRRATRAVRKRWRWAAVVALMVATAGGAVLMTPRVETSESKRANELKALAKELDIGGRVTLIGAQGIPPFGTTVRRGDDRTILATGTNGTFQVSSWADAMVELVPNTRRDSYRLRASVRHVQSDPGGLVGLYACDHCYSSPAGGENGLAVHLTLNDLFTAEEVVHAVMGNEVNRLLTKEVRAELNQAQLQMKGRGETSPGRVWEPGATFGGARFRARESATGWRVLEILVSPKNVSARLDGAPAGSESADTVAALVTGWRDEGAAANPDPRWGACRTRLTTRGGLGLVVRQGTAEFRDVVIEPLEP